MCIRDRSSANSVILLSIWDKAAEIESVRKDLKDQLRIVEADIFNRLEKLLLNKNAKVGRKKLKIDKALLESMKPQKWFEIKLQNQKLNDELETYYKAHKELEKEFKQKLQNNFQNIIFNGSQSQKLPGLVSISFLGFSSDVLIIKLDREKI